MTKTKEIKISTDELSLFYGKNIALKNVDIKVDNLPFYIYSES